MNIPVILNASILQPVLRDMPRNALDLYIILMMRLSRINYSYRIWQTNIVIYPDQELPFTSTEITEAREYLLNKGLITEYKDFFYKMTKPDSCAMLRRQFPNTVRDRKFLQSLRHSNNYAIRLRDFRTSHGLTQKQLARLLDIPLNTYKPWERGVRPSAKHISKLKVIVFNE